MSRSISGTRTRAKNAEAHNYGLQKKKERYFKTKDQVAAFVLTSQVLSHDQWTPDVLTSRQEALVNLLAKEWRLK